jgi:hypothetical protein
MAARTPRRSFAAPFVVTVVPSLATACYVDAQQPPPANPQTAERPRRGNPPEPVETDPASPPIAAPSELRFVYRKQNGICYAMPNPSCPSLPPGEPQLTCNPPPPKKVPCPDILAEGKQLNVVHNVAKNICMVDWGEIKCPAGATCNPPPPRKVDCP